MDASRFPFSLDHHWNFPILRSRTTHPWVGYAINKSYLSLGLTPSAVEPIGALDPLCSLGPIESPVGLATVLPSKPSCIQILNKPEDRDSP